MDPYEGYGMNNIEEIITQIKILSAYITEDTYFILIRQGYELLVRSYDMGVGKERVYQPLFQYHNSLDDGLARDYIADILDYAAGWCSPQGSIWND